MNQPGSAVSARFRPASTLLTVNLEEPDDDLAWMVVQRGDQKIIHVAPVGDVIRHRMLIDASSPLRLRDGIVLSCPCKPSVCVEPDGTRVVLHRPVAMREP